MTSVDALVKSLRDHDAQHMNEAADLIDALVNALTPFAQQAKRSKNVWSGKPDDTVYCGFVRYGHLRDAKFVIERLGVKL